MKSMINNAFPVKLAVPWPWNEENTRLRGGVWGGGWVVVVMGEGGGGGGVGEVGAWRGKGVKWEGRGEGDQRFMSWSWDSQSPDLFVASAEGTVEVY